MKASYQLSIGSGQHMKLPLFRSVCVRERERERRRRGRGSRGMREYMLRSEDGVESEGRETGLPGHCSSLPASSCRSSKGMEAGGSKGQQREREIPWTRGEKEPAAAAIQEQGSGGRGVGGGNGTWRIHPGPGGRWRLRDDDMEVRAGRWCWR